MSIELSAAMERLREYIEEQDDDVRLPLTCVEQLHEWLGEWIEQQVDDDADRNDVGGRGARRHVRDGDA